MIKSLLTKLLPAKWTQEGSEFCVQGESATVYWVSAESEEKMGKTTVFNTIYLNEQLKSAYPHHLVEYVVLHEMGHASQSRRSRIKHYTLTILFFVLAAILGALAVFFATKSLKADPALSGALSVVVLLAAVFSAETFRRKRQEEELQAELNALDTLGVAEFARRRGEIEQKHKRGIFDKLTRALFYPTLADILSEHKPS